jgi:putative hemolysin
LLNNLIARVVPVNTENVFSMLLLWPLVLIGGQIVPMTLGRQHANKLCLPVAKPLRIAYYVLFPLAYLASLLGRGIMRLFTRGRSKKNPFVTREELQLLLKESHEAGVLKKEEKEMIEEIFHFGELTARDAMVPLINVVAAPDTATVGDLRALIAGIGRSRLPIYSGRVDNIIGTIHATDLVGIPAEKDIREMVRPPYVVPESASLETVLVELQRNNKYMAVVVDEYGGASGILSLADIVEEIVGDIGDEETAGEAVRWEKRPDALVVDGRMHIDEFNRLFDQHLPIERAVTLGGFITDLVGRIPHTGGLVSFENLTFRVIEATDKRVVKLEIKEAGKAP